MPPRSPEPLSFSNDIFEACCFAPVPEDLSLTQLEVDEQGRPQNEMFAGRVLNLIRQRGTSVSKLYAPNAAQPSARIMPPSWFTTEVHLSAYLTLYNNSRHPCEGTWIEPGEGVVFNTKGCPILVFTGGRHCLVVHAGRDSLIDRQKIVTGHKSRYHEGVIHAVVERFRRLHISPNELQIQGFYGIDPQSFDHRFDDPVYGQINRMIADTYNRRGRKVIDTYADGSQKFVFGELIRLQSDELGIPQVNVSYSRRLPVKGHYAAHSTHPKSNLVMVLRKAA